MSIVIIAYLTLSAVCTLAVWAVIHGASKGLYLAPAKVPLCVPLDHRPK